MPILKLDGSVNDSFWVRAAMHFPNDLSAVQGCFAVDQTMALINGDSDNEKFEIDAYTLKTLINAPSFSTLKEQKIESTKRGTVAGDILATLYLMDRFGVERPSMNKAIFCAMEFAKKAKYGDGTPLAISEPSIRKFWNEFRPVAHLWAAFRLAQDYPYAPEPLHPNNHKKFLEVAQGIFEFGRNYIPKGSKSNKSILDGDYFWVIPKVVQASHLQSKRVPTLLLKTLKKYKAPRSIV